MPKPISLPLESYELRESQASTSRLLNCFVESLAEDSPWPYRLRRCEGMGQYTTAGTGPIEGLHVGHGLLYAVSGGGFYSITAAGTATFRGAVGSSPEIDMDHNDTAVVIVSPPNGYHYTPGTTTFAAITDSDFTALGAGNVRFCDNFMLFRAPDSGVIFGADLGSVSAFDALNFFTAEGSPDNCLGLEVDHRQVLPFGENSVEIWQNTGIAGFPFERLEPGYIERGIINGRTIAKLDQSVLWVADDYTVRRLEGMTPVRVSTHAIERWLEDEVTLVSLRGYSYTRLGHAFYILTAPEGCKVFDMNTGKWHDRKTYDRDSWDWGNPVSFNGYTLFGSTTSNVIGYLEPALYSELDETMRMEWRYQPVYASGYRAFFDRLEVVCEVGVGLTTGQGSDPQIMCDFSDDGGKTWKSLPNRSLGRIGNYAQRVHWDSLGSCASAHGRVFRMAVSDPVPVSILDTLLTMRGGRL